MRRLTEGLRRRLEREGRREAIPHAFEVGQELRRARVAVGGMLGEKHHDQGVIPSGMCGFSRFGGRSGSVTCFMHTAMELSAVKGSSPVSIS